MRGALMGCESPARECFTWHVLPKLPGAKHKIRDDGSRDPYSVRVKCPAHDDHEPSLGVSVVDGRLKYNCFACDNNAKVRLAMIRAFGINPGCLSLPAKERQDILDRLQDILTAEADHAEKVVRAVAALEGYPDLPQGGELARVAALARVGLASAYRARSPRRRSQDR